MAESEMVERVAKAILYDFMPHKDAWEIVDEDSRKRCIGYARAAIKAMREPTEAMNEAGLSPTYVWVDETAEPVWQRMIDAALST